MNQRIKAEPAGVFRGRITQKIRGITMGNLVYDDHDQKNRY